MRGAGTTLDSLSTIAAARNIMGAPGQETVRDDDDVTASIRSVVATIVAGQGVDPRPELERLGVGFVVLRSADTAAQLTASRMDAVPGLVAVGQTDVGWLWRITPLNQPALAGGRRSPPRADCGRRRSHGGAGALQVRRRRHHRCRRARKAGSWCSPNGQIRAGAPGSTAGNSPPPRQARPRPSPCPPRRGQLTIRYDAPWALWSGIAQATVFGLTVMLAIPMPARRPNTGLSRDEGSLRKEHQNA